MAFLDPVIDGKIKKKLLIINPVVLGSLFGSPLVTVKLLVAAPLGEKESFEV